jgi:hypothetical protein
MTSVKWSTHGQSYSLPTSIDPHNTDQPGTSNIGNVYPVSPNQMLSVSVEAQNPRRVLLSNVGSVGLIVADTQRAFPFGLRLPCGTAIELVTKSALWVSTPPTVLINSSRVAIVQSFAYVSVSVAN